MMFGKRCLAALVQLGLPLTLVACGGSGGAPGASGDPVAIHTLAYVVSECRQKDNDYFGRQALVIRHGDGDPVTVAELPYDTVPLHPGAGYCERYGLFRQGSLAIYGGVFTRLATSPDGSTVVFEETDDFSELSHEFLTPEQRGIFVVRADGTHLRKLDRPSRVGPVGAVPMSFSPDGRTITFVDIGPSLTGDDAIQIVTLDLATGARTQVTHLPPADPPSSGVFALGFLDNETIGFGSFANPDGLNPEGKRLGFSVKADGSGLKVTTVGNVLLPGGIVPIFTITGDHPVALTLTVSGAPSGPPHTDLTSVQEVFAFDGKNLLQLTNFGRTETGRGALAGADGEHVFFLASADPLGSNPTKNCQLFSIDRLGAALRQLTRFNQTELSEVGCDFFDDDPHGCALDLVGEDRITQTLVFASACDPADAKTQAEQIFAVHADGSGIRQLTTLRGLFYESDGTVHVELPGPIAYGPYRP